jgi:hypothetical protein
MTKALVAGVLIVGASAVTPAEQQSRTTPQPAVARVAPRAQNVARAESLATIQGNALSSADAQLPNVVVRLRDARTGRIADKQRTDKAGLFSFRRVEPGSYVIELLGADDTTVLAASDIVSVNAGETVSAVVKLPFRLEPFAGVLGHSVPSAAAVTAEAIASSILAVATRGEPTCPTGPTR